MNKKLIKKIQGDHALKNTLFSVGEIKLLRKMKKDGTLRRFGTILNHYKIGYKSNCMIVWKVPASKISRIGKLASKFTQISRCYERPAFDKFPYNLYTMVHGKSKTEIISFVKKVSREFKLSDYQLLWSVKELKKTSPTYVI